MLPWVCAGLSTAARASSRDAAGCVQGVLAHTLGFAQVRWSVAPVAEVFGEQNGATAADRGLGDQGIKDQVGDRP